MFPISWNSLFRKKDGAIVKMEDAMSGGGGGYTLPTASADTKGGVKIGSGLSMNGEILSVSGGGGGSIYNHNVLVANGDKKVAFNLVKNNQTPYTLDELWETSYNGGEPFQLYGSIAYGTNSVGQMNYSIMAELNNETRRFIFYHFGGSVVANLSNCTIEDHII